jgi:hypothetical protein
VVLAVVVLVVVVDMEVVVSQECSILLVLLLRGNKQQWTIINLRRRRKLGNSNEIGDAKQQSAVCSSVDAMAVMYVMGDVDLLIGTDPFIYGTTLIHHPSQPKSTSTIPVSV